MLGRMMANKITRSEDKPPHYYQREAVDGCDEWPGAEESWKKGFNRTLLCLPTGAGKSLVTGELCARAIEKGERCLFLCHTQELVKKPALDFEADFGCPSTIEMGALRADDSPMVFASVQTMKNRIKSGKWRPDTFRRVCLDESHRALSATHSYIADHFGVEGVEIMGCTATPRRGDKRDLMQFFDNISYDIPLDRLIGEGFLSQLVIQQEPLEIKVHGKSKTGEITDEEAGEAIEPYLERAADIAAHYGKGQCGLSFLPLRKLALRFRDLLRERGLSCEYVAGEGGNLGVSTEEQSRIKAALERGDIEHVTNAQLWGEGVDIRPLTFGVDLRPQRSWPAHMQKYGRFTRTFDPAASYAPRGCKWPKKTHATILDFCFSSDDHHMLQRPSTILAKDEQEAELLDAAIKRGGGKINLMEALQSARNEHAERLRKRLEEMRHRKSRLVNPMEYFISTGDTERAEYTPLARWEESAPSPAQLAYLLRNDFDMEEIKTKGQAAAIISSMGERRAKGLATVKQARWCGSLGHPDPWNLNFEQASAWIDSHKPSWSRR